MERMPARALGVLLPLLAAAIALAWCGAAEAKTGLAPVVVEGTTDSRIPRRIENAALEVLRAHGPNPPPPQEIAQALGLADPADAPTAAQCAAAGAQLGLDVIAVVRVRLDGDAAAVELRVVTVADGKERAYSLISDARHAAKDAAALVGEVFAEVREWDSGLVDVEHALGGDLDREYADYTADGGGGSFASYLYDRAARRRGGMIAVGVVIPTILVSATIALGVGTRSVWEDPYTSSDAEEDSGMPCIACGLGEVMLVAARVMVVLGIVVGTGGAILAAVGAGFGYKKQDRRMGALEPLLSRDGDGELPVSWRLAPWGSPEGGGLALDLRF